MSKVMVIDLARCNGCRNCQIACKDEHCGQPWLPYADEQPDTGHFWMKVNERTRGQVPVVKVAYQPTLCAHCEDAPCERACGADAFSRREDGLMLIDPAKCTGCKACIAACPIDAIYLNAEKGIAQKCTGCAHLLDDGWSVPRCVDSCATDALRFGEEGDFDLTEAACLDALNGCSPKVYYLNMPKRFIAGCIVDFASDEVVVGALISLRDVGGGKTADVKTDEFGDFMFDRIEAGAYEVVVTAEGFEPKTLQADVTSLDLSLGDIDVSS